MLSASTRKRLDAELRAWWDARGCQLDVWWRDDDAVAATPAFWRLRELSAQTESPAAIAVVPAAVESNLEEGLGDWEGTRVWQHGFAHRNHAPPGLKKTELGETRSLGERLAELSEGRAVLASLFGRRFQPVLVPPWNRIGADLPARLPDIGLFGLSVFKPRPQPAEPGPRLVNTHVDVIAWRNGGGFVGEDDAVSQLLSHWRARREGHVDANEPTGILTHHLVHDEATWQFLAALLAWLQDHPYAVVAHPAALFDQAEASARYGRDHDGDRPAVTPPGSVS